MARLLFAASEAFPLIKTGGLADVAGALPEVFRQKGMDVRMEVVENLKKLLAENDEVIIAGLVITRVYLMKVEA